MRKLIFVLFILPFLLTFTTHASDVSSPSDYEMFLASSEYDIIIELEDSTLSYFKKIVSAEGITLTTSLNALDYSNISKVYVDTGIEKINTNDKKTIDDLLANSNYVWVLPIEIGSNHFQITYARSGNFSTSTNWEVTEVALRPIEPYHTTLKTHPDTVIIGGIPSFQMPVALAFDNSKAVSWIDLGYSEMYFEELLGKKTVKTSSGIYDYLLVLEAMNDYSPSYGLGGTSQSRIMRFSQYLPFIIVFSGIGTILSILYLRKKYKH